MSKMSEMMSEIKEVMSGMKLNLNPSLEDRALVKIAITLWNLSDINDKVSKITSTHISKWEVIENMVVEKAYKLSLPDNLTDKLLVVIQQIGLKIRLWIEFHKLKTDIMPDLPVSLIWTQYGTIDNMKTAESLVKNENIDAKQRFNLACMYCLEDCVRDLGDKSCHHGGFCDCLKSFWDDYIGGYNSIHIKDILEEALRYSASDGNATAVKYFYNKLSLENKNMDLVEVASMVASKILNLLKIDDFTVESNTDVLFFLWSNLNFKQKVNFFKIIGNDKIRVVFTALLVWPRHRLFIQVAKCLWNFLSEYHYCELLLYIVRRVSFKRLYLNELIEEFWQETPERHKRYIIDNGLGSILIELYHRADKRIMQIILNDLSVQDKIQIICCDSFTGTLERLSDRQRLDLYEYFMQKCVLSPEEAKILEDSFRQYNLDKKKKRKAVDGANTSPFRHRKNRK